MNLSFTLGGGLGDYILDYLGSPGCRIAYMSKACSNIEFRVSKQCPAGIDLVKNSPYFSRINIFEERKFVDSRLENDIRNVANLSDYPKIPISLWLDEEEEDKLADISRPYAVFHPFASSGFRNLYNCFNIQRVSQWIADVSGVNVVVLGREDFGYESSNVKHIRCSSRLAVKIVERSSFFVGSHSSMLCAAWVYRVPSFCVAPNYLLFHNWYSPQNHDTYLKPLFVGKNKFMFYEQAEKFSYLFDDFLKGIFLKPCKSPGEYHRRLALLGMVSENFEFLGMS